MNWSGSQILNMNSTQTLNNEVLLIISKIKFDQMFNFQFFVQLWILLNVHYSFPVGSYIKFQIARISVSTANDAICPFSDFGMSWMYVYEA